MSRSLLALLAGCHSVPYVAPEGTAFDPDDDATVPLETTEPELTDPADPTEPTDPHVDSDGDGWDDATEPSGNTDPTDAQDHPYTGGWPIDACRDDVQSTGNRVGDIAQGFTLMDQNGEQVSLHDFCGQAVLLVSSAMWCGPCQAEASQLQALYTEYRLDGFLVITLLGENTFGGAPSRGDLQTWADSFGLRHPVLADPGFAVTSRFVTGGSIYLPTEHLIGPGAEVLARDTYVTEGQVAAALP